MGVKSFNTPYEIDLNTVDDEPVSVVINDENHVIFDSCVRLAQIPDEFYRVTISGMTEINIKDDISSATEFKVDYKHGVVYFDQSLEGDPVTIATYYGRGIKLVYAERIIAKILIDGSYVTLQEMIDDNFENVMSKSIYDPTLVEGDVFDADNHVYDNSLSGLTATNIQSAVDEIKTEVNDNYWTVGTTEPDSGWWVEEIV